MARRGCLRRRRPGARPAHGRDRADVDTAVTRVTVDPGLCVGTAECVPRYVVIARSHCSGSATNVIGNSIALYNPPVRVAEEFAMLDCISGGRLVAGFPVGTPMDTTFCYGETPATLRDKYREVAGGIPARCM